LNAAPNEVDAVDAVGSENSGGVGVGFATATGTSVCSGTSTAGFSFFTVLVTLGAEIRESTARTTGLVSTRSSSDGAASLRAPTGEENPRPAGLSFS
jgi:urocanate hydratase|tara:strand:+ start:1043 stop:1333 length:291 start_codon:yes stop_codon:yes gene_type:complete